jgi:histidyl-tRNA synthetase
VTADAEIIAVLTACLEALSFSEPRVRLNDRRILNGIAEVVGAGPLAEEMMRSLDKLDKMGEDAVREELQEKGFASDQSALLFEIAGLQGTNQEKLNAAETRLQSSAAAATGIAALRDILRYLDALGVPDSRVVVDLSLARGLEIYTGPVYEIEVPGLSTPSIAGGGRYDRLIGIFLNRQVPATGASFGLDRVANAMEELGLLPTPQGRCQVLVTVFDDATRLASLRAATQLRAAGINAEVYQGTDGLRSQFGYADRRGIPVAVIIGPDEEAAGSLAVRDLRTRTQETVPQASLVDAVQAALP